jgi:hypothetical protein
MKKNPENDQEVERTLIDESFPHHAYDVNFKYHTALERDVVGAACKLVTACRASGQHHEVLKNTIREGNKQGWFKDKSGSAYMLEELVLLQDIDTRWSSILYMIDRLIVNYPVGSNFLGFMTS